MYKILNNYQVWRLLLKLMKLVDPSKKKRKPDRIVVGGKISEERCSEKET